VDRADIANPLTGSSPENVSLQPANIANPLPVVHLCAPLRDSWPVQFPRDRTSHLASGQELQPNS